MSIQSNANHAKTRKLYHRSEHCPVPSQPEAGQTEFRCRCNRTWRWAGGGWLLIIWSAGFASNEV